MPIRDEGWSSTKSYTDRHYGDITELIYHLVMSNKYCHQVIKNELPTYRILGLSGQSKESGDTSVEFEITNFYFLKLMKLHKMKWNK